MLTLLLGTDWTTVRGDILHAVAEDVQQQKSGRILIVPELISHEMERRLCATAGDTSSRFAEVLSFTRLLRRVSDAAGQAGYECLDAGGRIVAMASAARQLHSKLKAYAAVETRPEFLTGLVEAVDEFKRCCITPQDLMQASHMSQGAFAQKLEELSLIYEAYDALCQRGKRDPRDQMTWLLELLEETSFSEDHVFYIEGFPDFTRQHMAIIEHLMKSSRHVTVGLNCDSPSSSSVAFEKVGRTAAQLLKCAKRLGVETQTVVVPGRNDKLKPVRRTLFQGKITEYCGGDSLRVYRTDTVYQECLAAAQQIMQRVEDGARFRQFGVVYTDPVYKNTLQMVFERFHIPVYLSGTEDILDKSVVQTVLSAMDTALSGFEREDVLHYLKSMLSPLDLETCDLIENYAVIWGINGQSWLKEWENHPEGLGQPWTEASVQLLQRLNQARKTALDPLLQLRNALKQADNLGQMVRGLYAFFCDIELSKRMDALARQLEEQGERRENQILNQLWEILIGAMEQLHDVLGNTVWDIETFTRLFRLLLSQYDVGTIPPVLDAVYAGVPAAMRCQKVQHLLVLGAAEGSFPGYGGCTGVLSDSERSALRQMGVPLTGGGMDGLQAAFYEIYGVFCGAMESVTVSCPAGQPSFIYRRLVDLAGGEWSIDLSSGSALADALEAGAFLVRSGAHDAADSAGIADSYNRISQAVTHELGNVCRERVRQLYGKKLNLSASQIDRHAQCRFSYFLQYGMRAKERKPITIDPAEFGTYVHAVLENTAKAVMKRGGFKKVSLEETLDIAHSFSESYAQERFAGISTQRIVYLFQRNLHELSMVVEELWIELSDSDFEPAGFEVAFGGKDGALPAVPIQGKEMDAQLRGFVDRVDIWNNGQQAYFRVVDYKTGKKSFDYCDVYNGLGLQMLLYLFALEQEGSELFGKDALPAGVQYFPARVPMLNAEHLLTDEEASQTRAAEWKRKGLLLDDDLVLSAMADEKTKDRLPCKWRKDGTVTGDLASMGQLRVLKKFVFHLLGAMVDEISSGCVDPNPYTRGSTFNACTYCPYASVCHSGEVSGRRNYKTMSAQRFWDEVDREVKDNG